MLRRDALRTSSLEEDDNPNPLFQKFTNCFYFVIVTATTVGYGDMAPVTVRPAAPGALRFFFSPRPTH